MNSPRRQLSNSFSTGGGGGHFEAHLQASFVVLMLTGGHAPCLPCWPIVKIKLQGRIEGFDTDDLIVFVENGDTGETRKLLGQVKHSVSITQSDTVFGEVIQAAWNDFNNPTVFTRGKDVIALITGPLSATDTHNVQWILGQARHTSGVDEFYRNVEQANFSPPKSEEKLAAIQHHLRTANNGTAVSREVLYDFLNHFHLLSYDLGTEHGVVLSLLHSPISQRNRNAPQMLWSRAVDIVQTWNQDAGTITRERLPEDLVDAFEPTIIAHIPEELTTKDLETQKTDWDRHQYASDLALANLVGAWDEKSAADIEALTGVIGIEYATWVKEAREILHLPGSPLSLKNGEWKVTERAELWSSLGSRVFDQHLDSFKAAAIAVLRERDPAFDLSPEDRFVASLRGKAPHHSSVLRMGLANGLAILGNHAGALANCSRGKAEATVILAIREIFTDADWKLWASLNNLLPVMAEAAPNEFLDAVENALQQSPCPFDELFAQEESGIMGRNYLTGLLWALEGLAWDEHYLVRVCVILGELASHDPGGNWTNRPINSLITILLPWYPQTLAPIEKRQVAVRTLCKESPGIGWNLIIQLLPNQHRTSSGSHRPSWRKIIPEDWESGVSGQEYWQQVFFYAELAVSMADYDAARLAELIEHLDKLPSSALDQLLGVLSSDAISGLPEEQRLLLWDQLTKCIIRHRRYSEAKWAFDDDRISQIEAVANAVAPENPLIRYQPLFSANDFDLYEGRDDWRQQQERLNERRLHAIEEILRTGGVDAVIELAKSVISPIQVGYILGSIADSIIDSELLPKYLDSETSQIISFIRGYVSSRFTVNGWPWVDGLDRSTWSLEQNAIFLSCLSFSKDTWDRADQWLGEEQGEYWSRTSAVPYGTDEDLHAAVEKLIDYGRPQAAIRCLDSMRHDNRPLDVTQCIRVLLTTVSSSEPVDSMARYHIVELIKYLQNNSEVPSDDIANIELIYLPLLDHDQGVAPKLLELRLATDPLFFCEVLQLIYRSRNEGAPRTEPTELSRAIASHGWQLLHHWQTVPGIQEDGSFDEDRFSAWLRRVQEICTDSGHIDVALSTIGEVLIYSPADATGLWINRTVAEALNARDAEDMRTGFRMGVLNSRGVHLVDPTGQPERELAEQFRQKADDVENVGFQRFAVTLRDLAERYDREAEQIIADHRQEAAE
ncbi:MAG: hypothetical protein WA040_01940 [Anaerolineae bacterium]